MAEEGGPVVRAGADAATLPVTAPTPEAEGHSRTHSPDAGTVVPAKPGKQSHQVSRKTWRDLEEQAGKLLPHASQKEETQEQMIQRQQEPGRQSPSPHPPVAHAWFVVFSPLTASGQRTEVTALVTASGHERGKGDPRQTYGRERPHRDRQRAKAATGHAESGQNTTTGHARTPSKR